MSRRRTMTLMQAIENPYQGSALRVLCVCRSGMLRSPSIANVLYEDFGFNTRAVGYDYTVALTLFDLVHFFWAQRIVYADHESYLSVRHVLNEEFSEDDPHRERVMKMFQRKSIILRIEDIYDYMNEDLVSEIRHQYSEATGAKYEPQGT